MALRHKYLCFSHPVDCLWSYSRKYFRTDLNTFVLFSLQRWFLEILNELQINFTIVYVFLPLEHFSIVLKRDWKVNDRIQKVGTFDCNIVYTLILLCLHSYIIWCTETVKTTKLEQRDSKFFLQSKATFTAILWCTKVSYK